MQPDTEQDPPGQYPEQYKLTLSHHAPNLKQSKEAGNPAVRKQEAICTVQAATAVLHDFESVKGGIGLEHHFPQVYSHVGGVGDTAYVDVQSVGVGVGVGVEVELVVLDGGGLPPLQGSVDSMSEAT